MKPFCFDIGGADLDLGATFECGQVFRWKLDGIRGWIGSDGAEVFVVRQVGNFVEGEATATEDGVRRLLDIERGDITEALCAAGPELADYFEGSRGVRMVQVSDPVETFAAFLCSANNHMRRIVPMVECLGALGVGLVEGVWGFPSLEVLASLDEGYLRERGFGYRAATVPRASREALSRGGREWLRQLGSCSYEEAFGELSSIYGFGPKLTDCVLLYGCGQMGAVPVDTHVWQLACDRLPGFSGDLTGRSYRGVGDWFRGRFGDLAGYGQQRAFAGRLFAVRGFRNPIP